MTMRGKNPALGSNEWNILKEKILKGVISDDYLMECLVLKGGNALSLIWKCSDRPSIDLDFSMRDDFELDLNVIEASLRRNLNREFSDDEYEVLMLNISPQQIHEDRPFWGGYRVEFMLVDKNLRERNADDYQKLCREAVVLGPKYRRKYTIDISRCEYVEPSERRLIDGLGLYVYTPAMILCEKIRSVCQQTESYCAKLGKARKERARDFYDIWLIDQKFGIDACAPENLEIIRKMFEVKQVELELLRTLESERAFHSSGFPSVRDTIGGGGRLMEYDFYFDEFMKTVGRLCQSFGIEQFPLR